MPCERKRERETETESVCVCIIHCMLNIGTLERGGRVCMREARVCMRVSVNGASSSRRVIDSASISRRVIDKEPECLHARESGCAWSEYVCLCERERATVTK